MTHHRYTIHWRDQSGDVLECRGLEPRVAMARLRNALRERGPITIVSAERELIGSAAEA